MGEVPRFHDFLSLYWSKIAPSWKLSTRERNEFCRRNHIDAAFPKMFIDEIEQPDIVRWFVGVSDRSGPGAGNRAFEIMRALSNKAEEWGVREESTNPCTGVRQNRRRKCERFLSHAELARLGAVLNAARETQPRATRTSMTAQCLKRSNASAALFGARWHFVLPRSPVVWGLAKLDRGKRRRELVRCCSCRHQKAARNPIQSGKANKATAPAAMKGAVQGLTTGSRSKIRLTRYPANRQ